LVLDALVLAGLLVVSSTETVPVEQFLKLSQEQHRIQHSGDYTNPKWFIPNTLKYYVLLHDMSEGEEQRYWKEFHPASYIAWCVSLLKNYE